MSNTGLIDESTTESRGVKRPRDEDESALYPPELKKMFKPLTCDLCGVSANSTLSAFTHYKGKSHRKKINKYLKENNIVLEVKKVTKEFTPTTCEPCNVLLTSQLQSLQHYSGKSHKKKMAEKQDGYEKIPVARDPHDPSGRFSIGRTFKNSTEPEPKSSAPQATPPPSTNENLNFCSICNIFTTSTEALEAHRLGAKHRKKIALEQAAEANSLSKYRTPSDYYYCPQCDITANSADQFLIHLKSKKHLANVKKKPSHA